MQINFPNIEGSGEIYLDVMRAICGDTKGKSMLDLGCHRAPYTPQLGFVHRTYVDVQDRPLDFKEEQQYFVKADINTYLLQNTHRWWDCIILSDVVEHFIKQDGWDLTWSMRLLSDKNIIFTPLSGLYVEAESKHPDTHKSGWIPKDLPDYACIVFPDFHKQINHGAFFAFYCEDLEKEFDRIKNELKNKSWIK